MVGLGFIGLGAGYWLIVYGFSQIRKQNAGFFQIIWPGALAKNLAPPDSGSGGAGNTGGSSTITGGPPTSGAQPPLGPVSGPGNPPPSQTTIAINSIAQAKRILANPKSSAAAKNAATQYLYVNNAVG